jgi:hypothetical protein
MATGMINGYYGHGLKEWAPIGPIYTNFGNKADLLHHSIRKKLVIPKRDIIKTEGRSITFCDGSSQNDVDILIMCTGYKVKFPFLEESYQPKKIRDLYKNIFCVEDPSLAFVVFSHFLPNPKYNIIFDTNVLQYSSHSIYITSASCVLFYYIYIYIYIYISCVHIPRPY